MNRFVLKLSPTATRDLDRLEARSARAILGKLTILEDNPFPKGKMIKKLKGMRSTFYRLRVGDYRIFYSVEGREVAVLRVILKKDAGKFIKGL